MRASLALFLLAAMAAAAEEISNLADEDEVSLPRGSRSEVYKLRLGKRSALIGAYQSRLVRFSRGFPSGNTDTLQVGQAGQV